MKEKCTYQKVRINEYAYVQHTHTHVQSKGKASGGKSRLTFNRAKEMRRN